MDKRCSTGILALFISVFCLSACSGSQNTNAIVPNSQQSASPDNSNSANTNVEELGILVNIPYEAEDIAWKNYPKSKRVIAVLRFSPEDSAKVVSEAETFGTPSSVPIEAETWFPEELTAQSEMSGDNVLKGMAYPANRFFQDPYVQGKIIRIEGTDFFILDLSSV